MEGNTIFQVFAPEVVAVIEPVHRRALAGQESAVDVPHEGWIYLLRLAPVRDDDGRIIAGMGSPRMGPELHRAITEDEFVVYGQPVIHLATGHRQRWNA